MKKLIALSTVTVLATSMYASTTDVETKLSQMEAKIAKLEKKLKKANENIIEIKTHDGQDDIKWDVDFRTAIDSLEYKHASGKKSKNKDLLTNRLWLGMGFNPNDNTIFKGKLSYMKAFGDSMNHSQANTTYGTTAYNNFDWVTNENANDNTVKVKEAYWLYMNDTFLDTQVPWTISIGRRPSTDGLGINMREGMQDNSPLSHTVNVEFDGLSAKFDLDKVTGVKGMWWKLCTGRGLTNAKPRFQMDGANYAAASSTPMSQGGDGASHTADTDMYGFIFVPYDNGQYSVHTNWARAEHLIGYNGADLQTFQQAYGTFVQSSTPTNALTLQMSAPQFKDVGSMDLFTAMFKADGIGDGINDFLDDTKFFASWAQSKTNPAEGEVMLGEAESKTGTSTWLGVNMPCPLTDNGRIGFEWNKGSQYWRSVTYAEDTMTGSKIAARGTAIEAYYNKPINNALSFNLRYTKISYDYTGSNSFFGAEGAAYDMSDVEANPAMYGDPVKESTDLRASVSYRF